MMKCAFSVLLIAVSVLLSSCFETEPGPKPSTTQQPPTMPQDGQASDPQRAWLEKTAQDDGVTQTDSGLLYKVIKAGNGAKPGPSDSVEVHYEGKLIDGTIFDSSYARGQSISFPLDGVIPGWTEGLQLMQEGAVYELTIPSQLGYGPYGQGPIPANATLIFKVELIAVQ